jgi:hypothetical protein
MPTTITKKKLKALLEFASDDTARHNLCGVACVAMPFGAALCATDGHRLLLVDGAATEDVGRFWSRTGLETALKASGKNDGITLAAGESGASIAFVGALTVPCDAGEIAYPNIAALARECEETPCQRFDVNARYLSAIEVLAMAVDGSDKSEPVTVLPPATPLGPIHFSARGSHAIVMPMRL